MYFYNYGNCNLLSYFYILDATVLFGVAIFFDESAIADLVVEIVVFLTWVVVPAFTLGVLVDFVAVDFFFCFSGA